MTALYRVAAVIGLIAMAGCDSFSGMPSRAKPDWHTPETPMKEKPMEWPDPFSEMAGWQQENHCDALQAFRNACGKSPAMIQFDGRTYPLGAACGKAASVSTQNAVACRHFFETHFTPIQVKPSSGQTPLFTGYYEIQLNGSRTKTREYRYPIYALPPGWAEAKEKKLPTRQAIDMGALTGKHLELVWVDDPVERYFLHIQGSGRVRLTDGSVMRLGFAGKNKHPYVSIGKVLIDRGEIPREEMSLFTLREWLREHELQSFEVMQQNPSYIFFRELMGEGPVGALGTALMPERSMAVDRSVIPLGVPLWLETTLPDGRRYNRMMVAEDTGSAITGRVRGDIFFGFGERAERLAGEMKQPGSYTILLPRSESQG